VTFALPDWLDPEIWADFERVRRLIKKPLTDTARKRIVKKLDDARSYCDPNDCLGETVENCWQGVYPRKPEDKAIEKEIELPGPWAKRL